MRVLSLLNATRYGIEQVGFRVSLNDADDYKGILGHSKAIGKVYGIDRDMKVCFGRLGFLTLKPKEEKNLSELGLQMNKEDAKMALGIDRVGKAENNVIEGATISLHLVGKEKPKSKPTPKPPTPKEVEEAMNV